MSLDVGDEDGIILAMIRELSGQLRLEKVQIDRVEWVTWPADWSDSYAIGLDCPFFKGNTVCMPAEMLGILQPDEWRPLLASSMILHFQVNVQRRYRRALATFLAAWALILPTALLLNLLVTVPPFPVAIGWILFFCLGMYVLFKIESWARLAADRKVARLLGKQNFLQALQKAADIDPDRDKIMGRDSTSTKRRIQNLLRS